MEAKNSNKNSFVTRVLIGIFLLFLAGLVSRSFYKSNFPYEITAGILVVLALMTVLVLSEAFNYFSIGKLLTLSREIESVTKDKDDLRQDNAELRKALLELSINVRQSQVNATINTSGVDILKALGVMKADKSADDNEQEEVVSSQQDSNKDQLYDREKRLKHYKFTRLAEAFALDKYIAENNIPKIDVEKDIQFTPSFEGLDPIMEKRITFDGYMKGINREYFFEVKSNLMSSIFFDRLYVMLSKILFYKQAKNISAELILIVLNADKATNEFHQAGYDNLLRVFQPAIASGLLRVEQLEITNDEFAELNKKLERENTK